MKKLKSLGRYPKVILLIMVVMILVFAILYSVVAARKGFAYQNAILMPTEENGNTVYSGEVNGMQAAFTVFADKTVIFEYGDKFYGPYSAKEDETAIPEGHDDMVGVELRCGEEVVFRGGVWEQEDFLWAINEDGSLSESHASDENWTVGDTIEPSVYTILDLMAGPKLSSKAVWMMWFIGVLVCLITVISFFFPDAMFRVHLNVRILGSVQHIEPSGSTMIGRYLTWTTLPVFALLLFIAGLMW